MARNLKLSALSVLLLAGSMNISADQAPIRVENLIAVLDLKCGEGADRKLAAPLTNIVIEELVKTGTFKVIDRANRDKILAEQGFQQSGCASEQCVVEMGQLLGVGKIVVGSIDLIGQTYMISLQLINVQTGAVENATSETCKCEPDGLIEVARNVTRKLVGGQPQVTPVNIATPPRTPPPTETPGTPRSCSGKQLVCGGNTLTFEPPEKWKAEYNDPRFLVWLTKSYSYIGISCEENTKQTPESLEKAFGEKQIESKEIVEINGERYYKMITKVETQTYFIMATVRKGAMVNFVGITGERERAKAMPVFEAVSQSLCFSN